MSIRQAVSLAGPTSRPLFASRIKPDEFARVGPSICLLLTHQFALRCETEIVIAVLSRERRDFISRCSVALFISNPINPPNNFALFFVDSKSE